MKKTFLALALMTGFQLSYADTANPFTHVEKMIEAKNMSGAYQELDKLGKSGNAEALFHQAYLLQVGQGIKQDYSKAKTLYEQSSQKGFGRASYTLAEHYLKGTLGLKTDTITGKRYLETAEKQGHTMASVDLALLLLAEGNANSEKAGLAKLDALIKADNPHAQYAKAMYLINAGIQKKSEKTVQQGLDNIESLSSKGFIPALMAVATMFVQGNLVDQDLPEAKKIFTELAKAKVPQAQESLNQVNKMLEQQNKKNNQKKP